MKPLILFNLLSFFILCFDDHVSFMFNSRKSRNVLQLVKTFWSWWDFLFKLFQVNDVIKIHETVYVPWNVMWSESTQFVNAAKILICLESDYLSLDDLSFFYSSQSHLDLILWDLLSVNHDVSEFLYVA